MWRDYFRQGQIHGVDIHEKRIGELRIHTHLGDQSDAEFMRDLGRRYGPFDVIVDDGSHIGSHILTAFHALYRESLNAGGYYVIEDLDCAYHSANQGGEPEGQDTPIGLLKSLIDAVNLDPSRIRALHLYEHVAFIQKGGMA